MGEKTLKECEEYLTDIKKRLKVILQEQEKALQEWSVAFATENLENIKCVCENTGQHYNFFIFKGDIGVEVADMWADEFEKDIDVFYKRLNSSIGMHKIINKSWNSFPEQFETLVMAEAMEVRRKILAIRDGSVISLKDRIKYRD